METLHTKSLNEFTMKSVSFENATEAYESTLFNAPPKILLLEDTKLIQILHVAVLTELGCTVDVAKTGEEALMMFKDDYDLIFMDVGLPDIRGTDVASYIRHLEKELDLKKNILLALTAYGKGVEDECLTAGMDALYEKPITKDGLKDALLKWLPDYLIKR